MTDRLSGLLKHYHLSARVFHTGVLCGRSAFDAPSGHIHVLRSGQLTATADVHETYRLDQPSLLFYPRAASHHFIASQQHPPDLVCATVDLGSRAGNPLALALPPVLLVPLEKLPRLSALLDVLFAEAMGNQCGREDALDRLCELLLIHLLRYLMDQRLASTGLLAGLADPRLAKSIAAIHDQPARAWTLDTLASTAGMSRARFAARFREVIGITPGRYLTGWRLNVVCSLLRQGKSVGVIADEVGYSSPTVLSRVFRSHMGESPRQWQAKNRSRSRA